MSRSRFPITKGWRAMLGQHPRREGHRRQDGDPLLQQYGTLEAIYEHLDEKKGSKREKLETGRDSAFMSKQLATIITDMPVTVELEKCVAHDYDTATVTQLLRYWNSAHCSRGCRSQIRNQCPRPRHHRRPTAGRTGSRWRCLICRVRRTACRTARNPFRVGENGCGRYGKCACRSGPCAGRGATIAFDTETTSTDQMRGELVGISLAINGKRATTFPVGHVAPGEGWRSAAPTAP